VFGCHGVSAIWGGIAAGCFASLDSGNVFSGLFFYDAHQFGINVLGVVVCVAYSFIMTLILCFLLGIFIEPRVTDQ
jgi:ammonia channel protein AmtB